MLVCNQTFGEWKQWCSYERLHWGDSCTFEYFALIIMVPLRIILFANRLCGPESLWKILTGFLIHFLSPVHWEALLTWYKNSTLSLNAYLSILKIIIEIKIKAKTLRPWHPEFILLLRKRLLYKLIEPLHCTELNKIYYKVTKRKVRIWYKSLDTWRLFKIHSILQIKAFVHYTIVLRYY